MITTALHFSGGKDSFAVLHLCRAELDEILVTWVNTGAAYPATLDLMAKIAESVPHFLEVKSDQAGQIALNGYPTDLVPLHFTTMGRMLRETAFPYKVQDTFYCCAQNLWEPIREAMKERGITRVIRGQRNSEKYKAPLRSGDVYDGIEYIFPLQDWSEADVFKYLKDNNVPIPPYYETEMHSQDCWNCTGYLDEAEGRILNLLPDQRAEVFSRLEKINLAINAQAAPMKRILEHGRV